MFSAGTTGPVDGTVVSGIGVQETSKGLGFLRNLADRPLGRPFEEHVLDHVGDPRDPIGLVEVPHLDVGSHAGQRDGVLLSNDHGQTVLQDDFRRLSDVFSKI